MAGMELKDVAPEGAMWWCCECGRISGDRYGILATLQGWTELCTLKAVLVTAGTMQVESNGRVRDAELLKEQLPPLMGADAPEIPH